MCSCKQKTPCFGEVVKFIEEHYTENLKCFNCLCKFYYLMIRITRSDRHLLSLVNFKLMGKIFNYHCVFVECFLLDAKDENFDTYLFNCEVDLYLFYHDLFRKARLPRFYISDDTVSDFTIMINRYLYKCIRNKECLSKFHWSVDYFSFHDDDREC